MDATALILDLLQIAGLVGLGAWYVRRVRALDRTEPRVAHPRWRLWSFIAGLLVAGLTVVPPVDWLASQVMWGHFFGIFLTSMIVSPLLVLGSPITLVFRTARPERRHRLRRFLRHPVTIRATFPAVTWLLFAVVTYLWQFTDMAEWAAQSAPVRDIENASLVMVGYLFWLPAIGLEPARWTPMYPVRLVYVVAEMVHKALFGAAFLSLNAPILGYFAENAPGWAPAPMTDQTISIIIASLGGNFVFLIACIWIIRGWIHSDARAAARIDRRLAREREAEKRRQEALEQVFDRSPSRPSDK